MPALLLPIFLGFILSSSSGALSITSPQSTALVQARDLKSDDVAVRRKAAAQLAGMKELPPDILPILRASIKDPDGDVASEAALALANAAPMVLHEIDLALQDPDTAVRSRMTGALTRARQIGPEIWPLLIRAFTDAYADVPYYAAQAFAKIGAPSLPLLQKTMHDSDPRLRRGACEALQRLGLLARPASSDLVSALGDPVPAVRFQAAYALAEIDPQEDQSVPVLIEALDDSAWLTRIHACDALFLLGSRGRAAVPSLLRRLATDADVATKERAAQALGKIRVLDAGQIEQMAKSLQDKEPLVRKAAADALGALAPEATTAIPFLVRAMSDDVNWIRNAAAAALGQFGAGALPALAETLKSEDIYVRQAAIWAFLQMKPLPPAAVPILIAQLEDKNAEVADGASGVLLQARIPGDWLSRYQVLKDEREARKTKQAGEEEGKQLYSKEDVIASIPPDADHKFPLQLASMIPFRGINGVQMLVTLHRGKDRTDRVAVWKQAGEMYQRVKLMVGPEPPGMASFEYINPFHYQGYPFLQITLLHSGTGHFVDDNIFAITRENNLEPVKLSTDPKQSQIVLKPGEGVWKGMSTRFSDDALAFEYYIWNEGDANCCPTAGRVTGTFKITRETRHDPVKGFYDEWTMSVDNAVREPIRK